MCVEKTQGGLKVDWHCTGKIGCVLEACQSVHFESYYQEAAHLDLCLKLNKLLAYAAMLTIYVREIQERGLCQGGGGSDSLTLFYHVHSNL